MFIEPGAPLVSFVCNDSDIDHDETWEQINTTRSPADEPLGIMWLNIHFKGFMHSCVYLHIHIKMCMCGCISMMMMMMMIFIMKGDIR